VGGVPERLADVAEVERVGAQVLVPRDRQRADEADPAEREQPDG
jgi:hypothetical protein